MISFHAPCPIGGRIAGHPAIQSVPVEAPVRACAAGPSRLASRRGFDPEVRPEHLYWTADASSEPKHPRVARRRRRSRTQLTRGGVQCTSLAPFVFLCCYHRRLAADPEIDALSAQVAMARDSGRFAVRQLAGIHPVFSCSSHRCVGACINPPCAPRLRRPARRPTCRSSGQRVPTVRGERG